MDSNSRIEKIKQRHADLLEQLRSLYEENPELEEEAPEGMLEILEPPAEGEYEVPEPPEVGATGEEDASLEGEPLEGERDVESHDPVLTPRQRVERRERGKAYRRKQRLHDRGLGPDPLPPPSSEPSEPDAGPLDLDDAVEVAGVRDPERDDVREMSDLAFSMRDYNRSMIALLKEMQDTMLETTHEMETIRARFARMR